ncbi:MAG: ABC transporter, ATP-binding protein 1 (cluster 4, leucine/isoleucine/valine/benzoate) [uncultured Caballeronia sp.]|nr:MAG: ABC transporter, ATP-binding protein 1 (cluster 4, leucine/isoleucine/valine/benzoate) [uncultured Caballeronia sp.]
MNTVPELKEITKRFGATQILRGVDLSIREGERHALIGPNGAGKSTLFDLIAGRTQPTSGRIALNGVDVTEMSAHRLRRKCLARTSVFTGLTVRDNIRCAVLGSHAATWKDRWFRSSVIDEEAHRVITAIGFADHSDALATSLSYAELRALDLGLALATGASVLLLDEPTAGMNHAEAARVLALIRETTQAKTLLIVEHDMEAVFALANRISVLVQGRVIATGTPAEIAANHCSEPSGSRGLSRRNAMSLNAGYGASHVLHDVSLRIGEGEIVALAGRNGSGRSTARQSADGACTRPRGSKLSRDIDDRKTASRYRADGRRLRA